MQLSSHNSFSTKTFLNVRHLGSHQSPNEVCRPSSHTTSNHYAGSMKPFSGSWRSPNSQLLIPLLLTGKELLTGCTVTTRCSQAIVLWLCAVLEHLPGLTCSDRQMRMNTNAHISDTLIWHNDNQHNDKGHLLLGQPRSPPGVPMVHHEKSQHENKCRPSIPAARFCAQQQQTNPLQTAQSH